MEKQELFLTYFLCYNSKDVLTIFYMRKILDERERVQRRQHRRLIITETLMFLAVIALVGFLTLVVMGYSFNLRGLSGGGEVVERTGLVQISSIPTGAAIYIDGESPLLLSTNASRTMLSGEHVIALKREGYYEWSKTISVTEGMMYRLNYPRLFKIERETEEVLKFEKPAQNASSVVIQDKVVKAASPKLVSVSPNHEKMLLHINTGLYVLNLNDNEPKLTELKITDSDGAAIRFDTISNVEWSGNSERLLAKVNGQLMVLNTKNLKDTVLLYENLANCISEQGSKDDWGAEQKCDKINVSEIKFESEAGDRLLILSDKNELLEFNVRDGRITRAISGKVKEFDNDNDRIVYVDEDGKLRAQRVGENESRLITELEEGSAEIAVMRYFQEAYVAVVNNGVFRVYSKTGWVAEDEDMTMVHEEEVGFETSEIKKRGKGLVFELRSEIGKNKVFDIEALASVRVDARDSDWMDEFLRYRLKEGKLSVFDYDGMNEHEIVSSGVLSGRTVAISGNNQWLYYFTSEKDGTERLAREKIL